MREKRYTTLQLILAALGGALVLALGALLCAYLVLGPRALALVEAWGIIESRFVGEYDPDQALDSALDGMVAGLGDRWSYALSKEDYDDQRQRRNNTYVGVGITVTYTDERGLLITAVRQGSPAAQGGLSAGEVVTAADGVSLAGEARWTGVDLIRGEAGTTVILTLLSGEGEERQVELERAELEVESVSYEVLEGNVGYVRLANFYRGSAEKLNAAVDDLVGQGVEALIFDMRSNGGGYVTELTDMLKHILPAGPVFRTQRPGGAEEVEQAPGEGVDLPMAVLVNADTYSAAELFAAQCKESVGAVIVGEPTSGKGYSQQTFPLTGGGAINISTARYTPGAGVSLVGTGVDLDAEVYLDDSGADAQLDKALELLGK